MRRTAKVIIGSLLVIAALGLAVLLAANRLLEHPPVQRALIEQAQDATGWTWQLEAAPRIAWWPAPRLMLDRVKVTVDTNAPLPPLEIQGLEVRLRWASLVRGSPTPTQIFAAQVAGLPISENGTRGSAHEPLRFQFEELELLIRPQARAELSGVRVARTRVSWSKGVQHQELSIDDLRLQLAEPAQAQRIEAQGQARWRAVGSGHSWSSPLRLEGLVERGANGLALKLARFSLTATAPTRRAADTSLRLPETRISGTLEIEPRARRLRLSDARADVGAMTLSGRLLVEHRAEGAQLEGQLTLHPVDLRAWLQDLASEPPLRLWTPGERALRSVTGTMALHSTGASLMAEPVWIGFDGSQAWGRASWRPGAPASIRFALTLDHLDADPYLFGDAPDGATAGSSDAADRPPRAVAPASVAALIASAPPPALPDHQAPDELIGRLSIQDLQVMRLTTSGVHAEVRVSNADLALDLQAPAFYAGRLSGALLLGSLGTTPRLQILAKGDEIEIGSVWKALRGDQPISGRTELSLELATQGRRREELERNLSGDLALIIADARLSPIALDTLLAASGLASDERIGFPRIGGFDEISASFRGQSGRFRTQDFLARSALLLLAGSGIIDIPAQQLDLDLTATLQEAPDGRGINELTGLPMPLRVSGAWQAPKVQFDPGPALRQAAARALEEKLDQHRDDLRRLEEATGLRGLEQGLRNLFGGH